MNIKYIVIIVIALIVIFASSVGISYMITNDGNVENKDNNQVIENANNDEQKTNSVTVVEQEDKYTEINKNSQLALELFEFVPKMYQTYPNKMNYDYMLYEAIRRISEDETVEQVKIKDYFGYKYEDVDNMLKKIYGKDIEPVKKDSYVSPLEYFEAENVFCMYPYALDNTDNKMVIKSVEENSKTYKLTVYSVCIYVDVNSEDYNTVYIVTKDTMRKYYSLVSRNAETIKDTYKEYKLENGNLDPEKIVEELGYVLPIIEYTITKNYGEYYVSDIKDIY